MQIIIAKLGKTNLTPYVEQKGISRTLASLNLQQPTRSPPAPVSTTRSGAQAPILKQ